MTDLKTDALSVPGLEHSHHWSNGGLILGDNQGALPRYRVQRIRGIHALPDIAKGNKVRLAGSGEYPRPGRLLGKTVTYEGVIEAADLGSLRYRAGLLRGAMVPDLTISEGTMTLTDMGTGGAQFHYKAAVAQLEIDDEQVYGATNAMTPYARDYIVAVRLSDPRFYIDPIVVATSAAGNGANNPFVDAVNAGSADSPPVLRVTGPVNNFVVGIPGYKLTILTAIGAGHYADIDFAAKSIITDTGADIGGYRDIPNSTWWDAGAPGIPGGVPGPTTTRITLSQTAGNPGVGSTVRTSHYSASW